MRRRTIHAILLGGSFLFGFLGIAHIYGESVLPHRDAMAELPRTVLFTGDVMLSRDVGRVMRERNDFTFPFQRIASTTRAVDLVVGNFENPVSARGKDEGSIYSFRADPRAVEGLSYANFGLLQLANNHIVDWGREALADSVSLLHAAKIQTVGAGRNEAEANMPVVRNVGSAKLAFISYTDLYPASFAAEGERAGISRFDTDEIVRTISDLAHEADLVVVLMHWGEEYERAADAHQKELAHAFIDAGAALVVGTHPHVVQELERYKNGWVAYSLGNFVFDQNFSDATTEGAMLAVTIKEKKITEVREEPIVINNEYQPVLRAEQK